MISEVRYEPKVSTSQKVPFEETLSRTRLKRGTHTWAWPRQEWREEGMVEEKGTVPLLLSFSCADAIIAVPLWKAFLSLTACTVWLSFLFFNPVFILFILLFLSIYLGNDGISLHDGDWLFYIYFWLFVVIGYITSWSFVIKKENPNTKYNTNRPTLRH